MQGHVFTFRAAALAGVAIIGTLAAPATAQAAAAAIRTSSQPLDLTLSAIARQANVNILFKRSVVHAFNAPALSGNFTVLDAIRRAVAGTGLEVFAVSERSFVIRAPSASRPLPTPSAAVALQPVAAYQPSAPRAESAAQIAPETPSGGDIIVTAQKRAERIQDVPLAVTALSGASLANHQINDTTTLVKAVPSLTFQAGNNPSNNSFRIRGVGTAIFSLGVEPSVSVVVDGVVQARQAQNFADLADIERVEVLRGPQGTLFGKNATAGVINVVTARPSHTWTAQSSATVAQEHEYRFSGSLSGPLSETLRMRITGFGNDIGGYQTNVSDGSKRGGSHGWGVRGKLEWDASDRLNLLASAEYRMNDATCCSYILANAQSPLRAALYNGAGVPVSATTDLVWNSGKSYANSDQQTYSLQATYDLDWATITSVSAYQYFNIDTNFEADRLGSSVPIYLSPTSNALFDYNVATTRTNQISQELRLDSKAGERLTYTIGGYYSHLILDRPSARRRVVCSSGTVGQPCAAATISYQSLVSNALLKNDHVAAFGQAEYALIGRLKLLAGLRVQHESFSVYGPANTVMVAGDAPYSALYPGGTAAASGNAVTGKAGAKYEFSRRAQVYGTYTRGYKGQGADTEIGINFSANPVLKPEHVNAYEIGFKGSTKDGTFSIATALFLADYQNLQVQANRSDPTTGLNVFQLTNAGSSQSKGFEIETTFQPVHAFSMTGGVTYTKPRLNADGLNCPIQNQAAAVVIPVGGAHPVNTCYIPQSINAAGVVVNGGRVQDVRGGETPATPHWRVNLSPRLVLPLSARLDGFAEADLSYQSAQNFAIEQDPNQVQPAYTLVDLSFGIRQVDSRYSLTFFVKNLFNQNYFTTSQGSNLLPSNLNLVDKFAIRPKDADRYLGATLSVKY